MLLATLVAPAAPGAAFGSTRSKHKPVPLQDRPIAVSVAAEAAAEPVPPVPQNFLGLSFEVGSLARIASYAHDGDLVTLLRSLGTGVLRFGGVTADEQIAWSDAETPRPAWALGVLEAGSLDELEGWRRRAAGMCC